MARPGRQRRGAVVERSPISVPVVVPAVALQFIHEDDVGQALFQCVVGAGPPGVYNIAGDGTVTAHDVARELGLAPIAFPLGITQQVAHAIASIPVPAFLPPVTGWAEALSQPAIVDTTKAKRYLAWKPHYTSLQALHTTLHPDI